MAEEHLLDLSVLEPAPVKVKLPDGLLYDMANPESMGPLSIQRLTSRYRRAEAIGGTTDASQADVEEMMSLLIDVAQVIVPDAPRDLVGSLSLRRLERLVQAFFDASPAGKEETEATSAVTSPDSTASTDQPPPDPATG